MSPRVRYWLICLPLSTLFTIGAVKHHLTFWWTLFGCIAMCMFASWAAD